ncbi:MAG: Zn-dependent alcohol dehydrogenase [Planctomycetota bacterium]
MSRARIVRAAVSTTHGGYTLEDVEVFAPAAGEVAVQLRASGICHTDYDSMSWGHHHVMGHEGAGEVTAVGPGVTSVVPGDRVLLNWAVPCGTCHACVRGHQNICEQWNEVTAPDASGAAHAEATTLTGKPIRRSFHLGTMSGHTVVREQAVIRIPDHVEIPWSSACIIGCGVMTGYGSAVNSGKAKAGDDCVVLGCGGVGLNAIQGCRIAGAAKVIAVDLSETRLEMAKTFGATHVIQAERQDAGLAAVAEKVKRLCGGRGADLAVECTAVPALGAAPLAMVRSGGTAVQASGIEEDITIDMRLFEWDKTYINPLYGGCRPAIDLPLLLDLYAKGDLLLDEMISRSYALEELGEAFDDMHHGRIAKGVIEFDH